MANDWYNIFCDSCGVMYKLLLKRHLSDDALKARLKERGWMYAPGGKRFCARCTYA